ncbi:hypothetical protein D1BOALGB6SA_6540 [Olavius sp. associated proteobacterium Delta 1]|nr:hypothetical protein D1BOALGB6SA_6540 [Olavius sp. associated proteobacterium Delta 1]
MRNTPDLINGQGEFKKNSEVGIRKSEKIEAVIMRSKWNHCLR